MIEAVSFSGVSVLVSAGDPPVLTTVHCVHSLQVIRAREELVKSADRLERRLERLFPAAEGGDELGRCHLASCL